MVDDLDNLDPPAPAEPSTTEEWLRKIEKHTYVTKLWVQFFGLMLVLLFVLVLFGGHMSCRAG